ncbi:hypothetical protein pqer_cds_1120 [Pandoravirus quercus]|uniref:Uncharacterized protein n=2 Tax=Pandoravirus TaxID=2060084 RepID=A0A2U7UAW5_9VIRU|nr:hypothetical protein pqer_cds_1120 [Pandoravirus quercus]AVK75542.1 hypothetical protein pqer_cds_1120 [Pandoravirus quercus]QBZ81717.1 hypothetical protein pclt_cds_1135 [Pandoravirus celtis]
MGNTQAKASFDVRANIRIYHEHARGKTALQEARKKDIRRLKEDLYRSQFGADMPADADCKLVWFAVDGGRVPLVVTPTAPTLCEIEQKIIPNAYNWTDTDDCEFPLARAKVSLRAGRSPLKERPSDAAFYASIDDGDTLSWRIGRMGCCGCRCAR